mgnify:CR=1 FL=1
MKYAPKKVFILENGVYKEISYNELKQLEQADKSYGTFRLSEEMNRRGIKTHAGEKFQQHSINNPAKQGISWNIRTRRETVARKRVYTDNNGKRV